MKKKSTRYSRLYRQYRYLTKKLNQQIDDGSFWNFSRERQHALKARLRRLVLRLNEVVSGAFLRKTLGAAVILFGLQTQVAGQTFAPPVTNPFGLPVTPGVPFNIHTVVDIDGDGDLDIISSTSDPITYTGVVNFIQNTGTATNPVFAAPVSNTFGISSATFFTDWEFADMDNDGDFDAFLGEYGGAISYLENTGSATAASFAAPVTNPFGIPTGYYYSFPTVGDLDGDGDLDLLISEYYGEFTYYENTGSPTVPSFAAGVANPFGLPLPSTSTYFYHQELVDLDQDGDLDLLCGNYASPSADVIFFENTGTTTLPAFGPAQANPFGLSATGDFAFLAGGDFDADSDIDVLLSEYAGNFVYFENIDSTSLNTPPSLDTLSSQVICAGDSLMLPFTATDADGDTLSLFASSDNQVLLANASLIISGASPSYSLLAVSTPGGFGLANITVSVTDGQDTTSTTFPLQIDSCNTAPVLPALQDVAICKDSMLTPISFQVIDAEGDSLTVTATSSNQVLLPDGNLNVTGMGSMYTLSGTPVTGETGLATISMIADDGQASDTTMFSLEVVACNTAPQIDSIFVETLCGNVGTEMIPFTATDVDGDSLTLTVISADQLVVSDADLSITGAAPNYTLNIIQGFGMTSLTITASDDSVSTSLTFDVNFVGCHSIANPLLAENFTFSPNPTEGRLIIEATERQEIHAIRVVDLQGRNLIDQQEQGRNTSWELDLQALPQGIYMIQVETEKGVFYQRIIRQ